MLKPEEQTRLVENIAGHLKDAQEFIQKRTVRNFAQCDPEYGRRIQELLDMYKLEVGKTSQAHIFKEKNQNLDFIS